MPSSTTTWPPEEELRATLARDGFVRIPHAFSDEELSSFRTAAGRATARARSGKWPYVRTVPKQFPPWPLNEVTSHGIWGVQHLLHPTMPDEDGRIFASSYFGDTMIAAVTALLNCQKEDLVMELYNMLVCPPKDFALRWHRDDIGPDVSPEEETERLNEPMMHAQWNLALYPDASLVVVPGSHRRPRTDMERSADPFEDEMPGQRVVRMGPGDVSSGDIPACSKQAQLTFTCSKIVFYNNNILHRGVYDSNSERMTLHGTMG
jgi:hypothetical protein